MLVTPCSWSPRIRHDSVCAPTRTLTAFIIRRSKVLLVHILTFSGRPLFRCAILALGPLSVLDRAKPQATSAAMVARRQRASGRLATPMCAWEGTVENAGGWHKAWREQQAYARARSGAGVAREERVARRESAPCGECVARSGAGTIHICLCSILLARVHSSRDSLATRIHAEGTDRSSTRRRRRPRVACRSQRPWAPSRRSDPDVRVAGVERASVCETQSERPAAT